MNTQQPEALRLADFLERNYDFYPSSEQMNASDELRRQFDEIKRLHLVNADLLEALNRIASIELQMYGRDWDEIKEAQAIAEAAIARAEGLNKAQEKL